MKINPRHKKTAPKVRDGKVQKINNLHETTTYWNREQPVPVIDKEPPGKGYKHFVRKKDILDFIELLPEWDELSRGLNAIVLSRGHPSADGWCSSQHGVVEICAWERERWAEFSVRGYHDHKDLLERLGVECENRKTYYLCKFDDAGIRAYQLLHVLLHELGHHHDRMTTKKKKNISRGESYAETYAFRYEQQIWDAYFDKFGY